VEEPEEETVIMEDKCKKEVIQVLLDTIVEVEEVKHLKPMILVVLVEEVVMMLGCQEGAKTRVEEMTVEENSQR
jgi:hypothetical protein